MRGFLNIDKPSGMTSFDVVRAVRGASGVKRAGHAGTLDPLATGVLPVAVGDATRLIGTLVDASKRYTAEVSLGVETTTDDSEGEVTATADPGGVTEAQVRIALERFVGRQWQTPPAYSAIKQAGVPAYRAARRGEAPELRPREVVAHALALLEYRAGRCVIDVQCGKGFYVRSLARELGRALGVYGHVSALRRTAVGPFVIGGAIPLDDVLELLRRRELETVLHAPDAVLVDWPAILLDNNDVTDVRMGRSVAPPLRAEAVVAAGTLARAYDSRGALVGLAVYREGACWHPYRVFADDTPSQ
jgi:tRNA pseudouridine55 synthase